MKNAEYVLSLMLALLLLGGLTAWTEATQHRSTARVSCRPGLAAQPVMLKGMSVYPRCPGTKRG